jgi:hypothetical protein
MYATITLITQMGQRFDPRRTRNTAQLPTVKGRI